MKTLKKRFMSTALAGAMALSLAVPAIAAENQTVITAAYAKSDIAVTVPETGTATINPYGLDVKLDDAGTNKISGNQIVTLPLAVVNQSEMTLGVSATVTAEATGGFTFGTASTNVATTRTKTGVVYFQMKADSSLEDGDLESEANIAAKKDVCGFKAASINQLFEDWGEFTTAGAKDLLLKSTAASSGTDLAILDPINTATGSNHEKVGGVGLFRLAGNVVTAPTEAWEETDGFNATVAFTFSPVKTYTITVGTVSNSGSVTVSPTSAPAGATVTITGTGANSETAATYTVTPADTNIPAITVTPDPDDALSGTFTMPASNVTITGSMT